MSENQGARKRIRLLRKIIQGDLKNFINCPLGKLPSVKQAKPGSPKTSNRPVDFLQKTHMFSRPLI